ncbi:uroporphyrinogen-III C-methyltransferase [Shigella flexneri]
MRAYDDTDDAATKAFLEEVDQLSQQNISMDVPETLQSQAILERLMRPAYVIYWRNLRGTGAAHAPAP